MSINCDAIVFFGIPLGERQEWLPGGWENEVDEWETAYAQKLGEVEPTIPWSWTDTAAMKLWNDYGDRKDALVAACPVEMTRYGNCCINPAEDAICIKASKQVVEWTCEPLKVMGLTYCRSTDQEAKWREEIVKFAALLGIPLPEDGEIGWQLAARYW